MSDFFFFFLVHIDTCVDRFILDFISILSISFV